MLQGDNRLNLLLTSREIYQEAAPVFYSQNFIFTTMRDENIRDEDVRVFHGILAAEAFLRHRRFSQAYIRELEFDMWQTGDPMNPGREFGGITEAMDARASSSTGQSLAWTNGVGRLSHLATALNGLPNLQHLHLNFGNRAPSWHFDGVFVSAPQIQTNGCRS